ncbi:hypothetical protein RKD37_007256 [Streptomyces ambofaciens]
MPTTSRETISTSVPDSPRPSVSPNARIGSTSAAVAMISVTRLATGFRISGTVEKTPSVATGSSAVPSVVPVPRTLAWNWAKYVSQHRTAPSIAPCCT